MIQTDVCRAVAEDQSRLNRAERIDQLLEDDNAILTAIETAQERRAEMLSLLTILVDPGSPLLREASKRMRDLLTTEFDHDGWH